MFLDRKISNLERAMAQNDAEGIRRAIEPLVTCLKDQDYSVRNRAAEVLAKSGKAAVEPLIACLNNQRGIAQQHAAEMLGKLGDPRAVGPLLNLLKYQDWATRSFAAKALGHLGDSRALGPLIARLKDQEDCVRSSAASALGGLGDVRAVPALVAVLKDSEWSVRMSAAWALGHLGDARAVEPLSACINDQEKLVRVGAAAALNMLGHVGPAASMTAAAQEQDMGERMSTPRAYGNFFTCLIPDRPLTGLERVVTTGGTFRGIFRPAWATFDQDEVVVQSSTDVLAGSVTVVAARLPLKEILEVRVSPITYSEQIKAALVRSLAWSIGIFIGLILIATLKGAVQFHVVNITVSLGVCLLCGLLFSFLPSYRRMERDLFNVLLVGHANQALALVVKAAERDAALGVCEAHGLRVLMTT
jgi:HEAT repeat protein